MVTEIILAFAFTIQACQVLILIVLDYGHWAEMWNKRLSTVKPVLILIVLDYGHWVILF